MAFPPMPLLPITSPKTIEKCASLPLRPSDIFICSYPKSGTTWTQHIVLSLIVAARRHGGGGDLEYDHVSDLAPFFEIDAHWESQHDSLAERVRAGHARLGRRVFNTHLRWEMLPKRPEAERGLTKHCDSDAERLRPACAKFLYITRCQPDVCASFYHHLSNQREGTYIGGYEAFARDWMAGSLPFGSSLHHLLSFAAGFGDNAYAGHNGANAPERPLLLLSYEQMTRDLRGEVQRITEFLDLTIPAKVIDEELLPSFHFQHMRKNIERFQPRSVTWLNGYNFLRKGANGDGAGCMALHPSILTRYREWVEEERYILGIRERLRPSSADAELQWTWLVFQGLVAVNGNFTAEEDVAN